MSHQLTSLVALLLAASPGWAAQEPPRATTGGQTGSAASEAVYTTTGEIKGLDPARGTVVLAHEPVPALKWSAMTMPFQITPELLKGLKAGQRVTVEFRATGMNATILKVKVLK